MLLDLVLAFPVVRPTVFIPVPAPVPVVAVVPPVSPVPTLTIPAPTVFFCRFRDLCFFCLFFCFSCFCSCLSAGALAKTGPISLFSLFSLRIHGERANDCNLLARIPKGDSDTIGGVIMSDVHRHVHTARPIDVRSASEPTPATFWLLRPNGGGQLGVDIGIIG